MRVASAVDGVDDIMASVVDTFSTDTAVSGVAIGECETEGMADSRSGALAEVCRGGCGTG
jgi:hypothetical protein